MFKLSLIVMIMPTTILVVLWIWCQTLMRLQNMYLKHRSFIKHNGLWIFYIIFKVRLNAFKIVSYIIFAYIFFSLFFSIASHWVVNRSLFLLQKWKMKRKMVWNKMELADKMNERCSHRAWNAENDVSHIGKFNVDGDRIVMMC